MTWKKYFKVADTSGTMSPISGGMSQANGSIGLRNYQNNLPEVYSGHPNRIDRYNQYETMDMDSEINACLDIIAEFSTQRNDQNKTSFNLIYSEDPTDNEVKILSQQLRQWTKLQEFDKRIFKIFRNTLKYGDQIFIRDPETYKMFWVEPVKVSRVIVNESEGKKPEQYVIQDINPNFENLSVAVKTTSDFQNAPPGGGYTAPQTYSTVQSQGNQGSRFQFNPSESAIDAENIVHLSLTEGLDYHWPFGQSIMEQVFKPYKQKELLEDAILIYRIQRAPERRVFYIDTGSMPSHLALGFVERIKNEIHQRRIPTQNGAGDSMVDASYSPLSQNEDYFFPVGENGRSSKVEVLPGGQNLSEIDDLRLWNNKLARGLRVPSSYLPSGPNDSADSAGYNDGRLGTALIQEYRFNQYCERLQSSVITQLNLEFKLYLRWRGFNIDAKLFDIEFNVPQNFASSRQSELDAVRLGNFSSVMDIPYISKRFALKRFLYLTEEEMLENETLWREENNTPDKTGSDSGGEDLRGVGITPGGMEGDLENMEDLKDIDADLEDIGDETTADDTGETDLP